MERTATSTTGATSLLLLLLLIVATSVAAEAASAPAAVVGGRRDIKDVGSNKEVQSLGRFAVAEHNRRLRHGGGRGNDPVSVLLSFRAVAAAQEQVVSGVAYYLKVIARDRATGCDRPFDAVVVVRAWLMSKELVSFTPSQK
ncbi:cysteine proteinase inhibitor 10-like [Phragmites australis]|uniref:cysteine proteinase inhibitor 10-like n=1 Tax=Phragmites australis TaxID=29695 RepID=UPI002D78FF3B|nr:cysteine proteinase inhibitor 10-like [Phragmites australis]